MPSQSHRSPSRMWRGMPWGVKATIQLLSILFVCMVDAAALEDSDGVVSLYRTIEEGTDCDFAGTMVIGNFFSLGPDDKFFALGSGQRTAFNIMIDHINRHKCGVRLDGLDGNYAIELRTYDDLGSTEGSSAVAYKLANDSSVDVLTAGYSSTLTQPYVEIAHNESDKLVLAPGAASTKVFLDKPLAFGMLPPTQKYLLQAVKALATISGAKTMATVWEDASFTRGVCAAAPGLAEQYGMTMTSMTEVVNTPNVTVLEPIAATLQAENPDVVITCVYDCAPWVRAMRKFGWSPKAQVFTVCVGQEKFSNEIGTDTAYLMGVTPWDASLQIEDAVTGWTPSEFASLYRTVLGEEETADVAYQSAMAGALISVLYQAVEAVGSFQDNGPELAEYISNNSFETMGGNFSFDENGQSMAPSLMVQYDAEQLVHTIYPLETASGPILYPMPSWDHRDCTILSTCEQQADNTTDYLPMGNVCNDEGICVCGDSINFKSVGSGSTANCIPLEEMNYINASLKTLSWVSVGFLLAFCISALAWIWWYRENTLVKVSQPLFLGLIVTGSILSSSSIIPMGVEASYREDTDNIKAVDAACMAIPWLWGMGFAVTYSALFAKVWRVRKLYSLAARMKRQSVDYKDVYYIIAIMLSAELIVLVVFQVISPHTWERTIISDVDGYAIESVGRCESQKGWWCFAALVGMNVICLFFALILCWMTKDIPSDFAESNYIFLSVMFMFQILVLAVPVSAMVRDNVNVFFFIRGAAVFFQNFSVLALIFMPKMRRIYIGEDTTSTVKRAMRSSMRSSMPNVHDKRSGVDGSADLGPYRRRRKSGSKNVSIDSVSRDRSRSHGEVSIGFDSTLAPGDFSDTPSPQMIAEDSSSSDFQTVDTSNKMAGKNGDANESVAFERGKLKSNERIEMGIDANTDGVIDIKS